MLGSLDKNLNIAKQYTFIAAPHTCRIKNKWIIQVSNNSTIILRHEPWKQNIDAVCF